jgi:hypothetical protein
MNIFGFQLAVKKFVKWNTINFLNYALILRRSVFSEKINLPSIVINSCNNAKVEVNFSFN